LRAGARAAISRALPAVPDIVRSGTKRQSGRSSGVEHDLAKVGVEGSNPFARSSAARDQNNSVILPTRKRGRRATGPTDGMGFAHARTPTHSPSRKAIIVSAPRNDKTRAKGIAMFARLKRIAPRRGWRAFAGEVGIIVLGVLIAVGIGKVVEALDWRDKLASAKIVLDKEISESGEPILTERQRVTPCLRRQLDHLRTAILAAGSNGVQVPTYTFLGVPRVYVHPIRTWARSTWESVVADNIPAQMNADEREVYRNYFDQMRRIDDDNKDEAVAASDLMPLHDGLRLDAATRVEFLRIIARERSRVDLIDLNSRQLQKRLRDSGRRYIMPAEDYQYLNTERWCRANGLFER